jgi:hypothetical protein
VGVLAAGTGQRRRYRGLAAAGLTAAAVAVVAAPIIAYQLTHRSAGAHVQLPPIVTAAGLVERSGVRVERVAVTGDGGLVDLRFLVVDADKAAAVHDLPPLLIDERTGGVINRPWMGHAHTHGLKLGVGYYVIFENTGMLIRSGSRVTVQLGNAWLRHVRVR